MNKRIPFFIALLALVLAIQAVPTMAAEWVLIANNKSGITRLTQDAVTNIYMGRYRRLDSGVAAEPLDQPADSWLKTHFYTGLVGKSLPEINAYWAHLIFSGKTQPPRTVGSSEEALQFVTHHIGALAYIERTKVDGRVMVVFEMGH